MNENTGKLNIFLSCIFYSIVAILVKFVSDKFDGIFISVCRYLTGIIIGLLVLKISRVPFKIRHKKSWILRGIIGSAAMILYFSAIQINSSGRATLLFYTYPVFVALSGYLFFKEQISKSSIISLIICIAGIILVFYDGSKYSLSGDLLGLSGGFLGGLTVHYIKKCSSNNHPVIVYLSACFFGLILLPFTCRQVVHLTWLSLVILLTIGALSLTGQVFMTYAYKYVSATTGSILSYLTIPLTILFSYFIGEELKTRFLLGIMLIIIGLILKRE